MDKYRFYSESEKSEILLTYQLNNLLKQTISQRTGIIRAIIEHYLEPNMPKVYNFSTVLCHGSRYGEGYFNAPQNNGAAGYSRVRSFIGSIGESLERYCSGFYNPKDLLFSSYKTLTERGYNTYDPTKITLYSDDQYKQNGFPFKKFTHDSMVCWVECEKLNPDGKSTPIYFPAWLMYMPYNRQPEESMYGYGISTGMAAGPIGSLRASISGLMETLERDAYMIVWHNSLPVPKIDWRKSPNIYNFIKKIFPDAEYADITLNLATTDIEIPCVIATKIQKNSPNMALIVGVAADLDLEKCIMEAIKEMAQDYYYIRYLVRSKITIEKLNDFSNIDDFEKRVVLWGYPEMLPHYNFLIEEPKETLTVDELKEKFPNFKKTFKSDEERLYHLIKVCDDLGYDVIRKDITSSDSYIVGVQVCKTFVPQSHPMEGNQNYRFRGGKRLYETPVKMGYYKTPLKEDKFNPIPHPLP